MKEKSLRKLHQRIGIILALFIIFQAGSGLLISIGEIETPHNHAHSDGTAHSETHHRGESVLETSVSFIHHGAGTAGDIYRILLGIGILGMAVTGTMIHFKIRARTKRE